MAGIDPLDTRLHPDMMHEGHRAFLEHAVDFAVVCPKFADDVLVEHGHFRRVPGVIRSSHVPSLSSESKVDATGVAPNCLM